MIWAYLLTLNNIRLCHSTESNLLVTYSISALIVSQQTYDVSCLGAFAEKGVFGFLLTTVTKQLHSFETIYDLSTTFLCFFNCKSYPLEAVFP